MKSYMIATIVFIGTFSALLAQEEKDVKVQIQFVKEGYNNHKEFAKKASQYLEKAINSDQFEKKVKNGFYSEDNNLSPDDIYYLILDAYEKQCPERKLDKSIICPKGEKGIVNLRVRTVDNTDRKKWQRRCKKKFKPGSTIGIDGTGDGVTAICAKRLKAWDEANRYDKLAGHYMHEYMHILGFSHFKKKSTSVVYQIGNIVRDIVEEMIKEENN